MVSAEVHAVDQEDIGTLVKHLESYGIVSAKIRCLLLLLRDGVNKGKCNIFVSGPPEDIATVVITEASSESSSVSVFARDEAGSLARLTSLLLAPELDAPLWRRPFRADHLPAYLEPPLRAAVDQRGFTWHHLVTLEMFVRPADLPPPQLEQRTGLTVRPLDASHLSCVKHFWPHAAGAKDADAIMGDGLAAGLSAGVFLAEEGSATPSEPVSWVLLNRNGDLGFAHTLESHRRRGLARLAIAKLTRLCEERGYPATCFTHPLNVGVTRTLARLGFKSAGPSALGKAEPADGD